MTMADSWAAMTDALAFATSCIDDDADPLNERERADGHQYLLRILRAVAESAVVAFDPTRPAFLPMLESVRHLGAAGPDIDYDVAPLLPGARYRISGERGEASFVGITVYAGAGEQGASAIVASVDVDDIADSDGSFAYDLSDPAAVRVIVRQYFHDRATQARGHWTVEMVDGDDGTATSPAASRPTVAGVQARVANAAQSIRWNAQLNRLWTPELRAEPNRFVRQTAHDIVAAVPNPDVTYAFTWWRLGEGEALVVDLVPPTTRYWSLQLCDRWFQCFPDRRSCLNDRQVTTNDDGSVRLVLADGDPGHPNWLDTSGHRTGIAFFRWLHADPEALPTCRVVRLDDVAAS